jgi:hypothetical protein
MLENVLVSGSAKKDENRTGDGGVLVIAMRRLPSVLFSLTPETISN